MTDIIVVQGPCGTVHAVDVDSIEEIFDLPAYRPDLQQHGAVDPFDEDELFACNFDPHRVQVLKLISEGGLATVTVREYHRGSRHDGHPTRPTKWHK